MKDGIRTFLLTLGAMLLMVPAVASAQELVLRSRLAGGAIDGLVPSGMRITASGRVKGGSARK